MEMTKCCFKNKSAATQVRSTDTLTSRFSLRDAPKANKNWGYNDCRVAAVHPGLSRERILSGIRRSRTSCVVPPAFARFLTEDRHPGAAELRPAPRRQGRVRGPRRVAHVPHGARVPAARPRPALSGDIERPGPRRLPRCCAAPCTACNVERRAEQAAMGSLRGLRLAAGEERADPREGRGSGACAACVAVAGEGEAWASRLRRLARSGPSTWCPVCTTLSNFPGPDSLLFPPHSVPCRLLEFPP